MTDTKKTTTNPQPQAPDYGEPWENGLYPNDIGDRYGHKVAQIGPKKTKHKDRIILCVNACAGIPNEALNERFILEAVQEKFERMKQKHDEQKGTNHEQE